MKLKIKGVEYDADKAQAAIDALEAELVVADKNAKDARAALDAKDAELKEAVSDAALDKRVEERAAKEKAEKERAEKLQVVKDGYPDIADLDKKSQEFIDGLYAGLKRAAEADPDGLKRLTGVTGRKVEGQAAKDAAERAAEAERATARLTGRKAMLADLGK